MPAVPYVFQALGTTLRINRVCFKDMKEDNLQKIQGINIIQKVEVIK